MNEKTIIEIRVCTKCQLNTCQSHFFFTNCISKIRTMRFFNPLTILSLGFTFSKTRKALKHVDWVMKNDPKAKAAIAEFNASRKRADDAISSYCKRNPDSPLCKK